MAITTSPLTLTSGLKHIVDTDSNATAEADINGGAATLYLVYIDNSLNAAKSYTKFWNNAAPTVGTTAPDMSLPVDASSTLKLAIPAGIAFGTALSFATVSDAGGTAGTTDPTSDVRVELVIA